MNPIAQLFITGLKEKMASLAVEATDRFVANGVAEAKALRRGVRAGIELAFREHYLPAADMLPRNNVREEILKEVGTFFIEKASECFNDDCIVATRWLNKLADVDIAPKVVAQPQRSNKKGGRNTNAPKTGNSTRVTPPKPMPAASPETLMVS